MLILPAACARPATPAPAGEGLAIYLPAEKLSPAEVAQADLGTLRLADRPILSSADMVAYAWETHEITLTAPAAKRLSELKVPTSGAGIPFVVCAGGERIYSGAFSSIFSSFGFDGVVIVVWPDAQHKTIRIEDNYIGELADPRPDPRIREALERAGRLTGE